MDLQQPTAMQAAATDTAEPIKPVTPMVDCADIEPSKENIQPLRRGRNPHQLLKAIQRAPGGASNPPSSATPTPATPAIPAVDSIQPTSDPTITTTAINIASNPAPALPSFKSERKKLEEAIKSYSGPDPLIPWLAYINWTRQSYLSANLKSHLVPLLEKCTRTLLKDSRANQSLRYLQVWLMYMDQVPNPLEMFSFLHVHGACIQHAALYDSWAVALESAGRSSDALEILQMGLDRNAEPRSRLKVAMKRLQARVAKKVAEDVARQAADDGAAAAAGGGGAGSAHGGGAAAGLAVDENGNVARQPLQRLAASSSTTSFRQAMDVRGINGQTVYQHQGQSMVHSGGLGIGANGAHARNGSKSNFQIFCDTDMDTSSSSSSSSSWATNGSSSAAAAQGPSNPALPSFLPATGGPVAQSWTTFASTSQRSTQNSGKENTAYSSWDRALPSSGVGAGAHAQEGAVINLPMSSFASNNNNIRVFVDEECTQAEAARASRELLEKQQAEAHGSAMNPRARLEAAVMAQGSGSGHGPLRSVSEKGMQATLAKLNANPLRNMTKSSGSSSSSNPSTASSRNANNSSSGSSHRAS